MIFKSVVWIFVFFLWCVQMNEFFVNQFIVNFVIGCFGIVMMFFIKFVYLYGVFDLLMMDGVDDKFIVLMIDDGFLLRIYEILEILKMYKFKVIFFVYMDYIIVDRNSVLSDMIVQGYEIGYYMFCDMLSNDLMFVQFKLEFERSYEVLCFY